MSGKRCIGRCWPRRVDLRCDFSNCDMRRPLRELIHKGRLLSAKPKSVLFLKHHIVVFTFVYVVQKIPVSRNCLNNLQENRAENKYRMEGMVCRKSRWHGPGCGLLASKHLWRSHCGRTFFAPKMIVRLGKVIFCNHEERRCICPEGFTAVTGPGGNLMSESRESPFVAVRMDQRKAWRKLDASSNSPSSDVLRPFERSGWHGSQHGAGAGRAGAECGTGT